MATTVIKFICKISHSEKAFARKFGKELFESKKEETFKNDNYKCKICGYDPLSIPGIDSSDLNKYLECHLTDENEKNPENSKFITLCKACHLTQHIDVAIENKMVELTNSYLSQAEIVNICRTNSLELYLQDGSIRKLKKDPEEYLNDLKSGEKKYDKVKAIFTSNFKF